MSVTVFSPAKVNLFLAITGRRPDGFHDLVSLVAPLDFGDGLTAELVDSAGPGGRFELICNDRALSVDASNLVIRAAEAFVAVTGFAGRVRFTLNKRIPVGAGLGGGSSNAVAALRALNQLAGGIASEAQLAQIAPALGSDCALFLGNSPVIMRGRGDKIEALPDSAARRIRGTHLLIFKPAFSVSTAWAYGCMAQKASDEPAEASPYLAPDAAEGRLARWIASDGPLDALLGNNLEPVVFEKFVALPALVGKLRREHGASVQMSGSGSACFALAGDGQVTALESLIRESWGDTAFVQRARLG